MNLDELKSTKMRSPDRVLVLEVVDGEAPKNSIGNTDNRLFTGENKLHAVMETETCFWRLKYDRGVLPEEFKQHFTSFAMLLKHAEAYYKKRNIRVSRVDD